MPAHTPSSQSALLGLEALAASNFALEAMRAPVGLHLVDLAWR